MKKGIHPNYVDCVISCSCGNVIKTRSTKPKINVEICSSCHPFFTGKQKIIDTAGRVEKYKRRYTRKKTSSETSETSTDNS
ncbi:MAG: 50S ribosomal protein L31 [candidate division WOR-3 bacterium]|nr:50S ribosomal protein L31 [candidate division WOR-3 bacterium]MCX7756900.1 50S ribosomal protein L31 [candidate division WOR-3 bacterium]